MLESSPVALPPARPLKRSASTASLPTPPRTHHKRTLSRSRSRNSVVVSDDGESCSDDDARSITGRGNKKQRTELKSKEDEDDEAAFWTGVASVKPTTSTLHSRPNTPDASPVPMRKQYRTRSSLLSPPPSKRQAPKNVVPVTPPRRSKRVAEMRDSPENPFLADSPDSNLATLAAPSTPTRRAERPEVNYVFRGVRKTFTNPFYDPSASVEARARLPLDHEDYSPNPACSPKLLFPTARRPQQRSVSPSVRPHTRRLQAVGESDNEDDDTLSGPSKILFQKEIIRAAAGEAKNTSPVKRKTRAMTRPPAKVKASGSGRKPAMPLLKEDDTIL